jgi:hypothetical protein
MNSNFLNAQKIHFYQTNYQFIFLIQVSILSKFQKLSEDQVLVHTCSSPRRKRKKVPNISPFKFNTHDVNTKSQTHKKSPYLEKQKRLLVTIKIVWKCQKVSKNFPVLWKNRELGKMGAKESRQFPLTYDEAIKRGKKMTKKFLKW